MTALNLAVGASSDDAYQPGTTAGDSANLILTIGGLGTGAFPLVAPHRAVGVRFTAVTIPNAATINTAALKFASDGNWNTTTFHWFGQAADNAATFAAAENMLARAKTTASVFCNAENINHTAGTFYSWPNTSGDLSALVQEIVNRAGWASGNALVMLADGDGGAANASSTIRFWDFAANPGPTLVIDYTAAAAAAWPLLLPGPTRVRFIN